MSDYRETIAEKAASVKQQRLMGMVRAVQTGRMSAPSDTVAKLASSMKKKDVKDFASTKHKNLPTKKVSEEVVNEVAPAIAAGARMVGRHLLAKAAADRIKKKAKEKEEREEKDDEVEEGYSFEIGSGHKSAQKQAKIRNLAKGTNNPNEKSAALKKLSGPSLPLADSYEFVDEQKGQPYKVGDYVDHPATKAAMKKVKSQDIFKKNLKTVGDNLKKKPFGEETDLEEGMTMKDFKANRRKLKRKEASDDAKKRGHVGKEWYNSGRTYSPDEAKSGRANMQDHERSTRKRSAIDPEAEDDNYSADKTKNPKKLRKQKAMGESAISEGKKGLWDNIHAKRKRGERPAKPGEEGYPKTLNVEGAAWTRKEGQNKEGGLNEKGRKSYEAQNPGSDLKAPQPEGGPRKKSFCARMSGMKKKLTSSKTANDPDSRINKSLRKWKC